jgi:hypothetical protein
MQLSVVCCESKQERSADCIGSSLVGTDATVARQTCLATLAYGLRAKLPPR